MKKYSVLILILFINYSYAQDSKAYDENISKPNTAYHTAMDELNNSKSFYSLGHFEDQNFELGTINIPSSEKLLEIQQMLENNGYGPGNGGSSFLMEIDLIAKNLINLIKNNNAIFQEIEIANFQKTIAETHIVIVKDLNQNNRFIQALNFKDHKLIVFSKTEWETLSFHEKYILVLHEYLGIAGIEENNNFISNRLRDFPKHRIENGDQINRDSQLIEYFYSELSRSNSQIYQQVDSIRRKNVSGFLNDFQDVLELPLNRDERNLEILKIDESLYWGQIYYNNKSNQAELIDEGSEHHTYYVKIWINTVHYGGRIRGKSGIIYKCDLETYRYRSKDINISCKLEKIPEP